VTAGSLAGAFEQVADTAPDAPAVLDGAVTWSYRDLDERANAVAGALDRAGVAPGGLVGVTATRDASTVAAIMGVLKHGSAYVPLDPAYPAERLRFIAADAGLWCVVGAAGPPLPGTVAVSVADLDPTPHRPSPGPPPDAAAYVIYTSGSTGRPKGVVVEHRNVLALMDAARTVFTFGPADVWTAFHSFCFDFSVWEMWGALLHGGRLVCVPETELLDPAAFLDLLAASGVTVLNMVPSVFRHLALARQEEPLPLPALRQVIFGGEALDADAVARWRTADPPGGGPAFVNMYGITETTVHVTLHPVGPADLGRRGEGTRIGRALPHLQVAVVAADGGPAAAGESGELYVGGDGVARGYLHREELTAERFPVLRLGGATARRWFRSGDMVRRLTDGSLEYLGRADDQVKIRGFRIELAEIDAQLRAHPLVADVATAVQRGASGEPMLVSYVVPAGPGEWEPDLAAFAATVLPRHMIPAALRPVAALPRTPSGKLDRRALGRATAAEPAGDAHTRMGVASSSSSSSGSSGGIPGSLLTPRRT
jgi:nonribosomal peptide synthetase DhbF